MNNQDVTSIDIETKGLSPWGEGNELISWVLSRSGGLTYDWHTALDYKKKDPLQFVNGPLVGHNIVGFDGPWLLKEFGRLPADLWDTYVAAKLLNENDKGSLDAAAQKYLGEAKYDPGVNPQDLWQLDPPELLDYNRSDTDQTLRLQRALAPLLERQGLTGLFEFKMRVGRLLVDMMAAGLGFDRSYAERQLEGLYREAEELEALLNEAAGAELNWNSPQQVAKLLFDEWGMPEGLVSGQKIGERSVGKDALHALAAKANDPGVAGFLKGLERWRQVKKLGNSYLRPLMDERVGTDGRVHTVYKLAGTVTGRLSSAEPNLQNISNDPVVGGAFVPEEGRVFSKWDYRQLELVLAAWYAGETGLIEAFDSGRDLHTAVLAELKGVPYEVAVKRVQSGAWAKERGYTKNVHFSILYQGGPGAIVRQVRGAGVEMSWGEAEHRMQNWFETYPRVRAWIDRTVERAREFGVVQSPTGQPRRVPEITRGGWEARRAERQAVNALIQGLAAHVTLGGLLEVAEVLEQYDGARLVLTVHDSVVVEHRPEDAHPIDRDVRHALTEGVRRQCSDLFGFGHDLPLDVDGELGLGRLVGG